jgi:hypothetical protein
MKITLLARELCTLAKLCISVASHPGFNGIQALLPGVEIRDGFIMRFKTSVHNKHPIEERSMNTFLFMNVRSSFGLRLLAHPNRAAASKVRQMELLTIGALISIHCPLSHRNCGVSGSGESVNIGSKGVACQSLDHAMGQLIQVPLDVDRVFHPDMSISISAE